jgi:drug/metabolite transporter (DMT)-like permease
VTLALCAFAVLGFAANSLLARGALGANAIDPSSYTLVRLLTGSAMLVLLCAAARRHGVARGSPITPRTRRARLLAAGALASYATAFSYSYLQIGAALGALVLFPTVKIALLVHGHMRGERAPGREWAAAALGLAALAVLTAPGLRRPDPLGVVLMILAGLSWAAYTVGGRQEVDPLRATRGNFALATLAVSPLVVPAALAGHVTSHGVLLAVVSGAITSAIPYVVWYRVVPVLTGMQLGLAQLSVPVLAGIGAVAMLDEPLSTRLVVAAALIAAGVFVALGGRGRRIPASGWRQAD